MDDPPPPVAPSIRWGRVLAALLVLCLVLEGTTQAFVYVWSGSRYRSFHPYRWSAYGLVRNNPELTSVGFQINANGFRNLQTFAQKKPPRTLRVLILGGSVMYSGLGSTVIEGIDRVDSSSTVAQYLEQELRADPELAGLRVEVLNAAINFNRIVEVSAGYISEWAYWEPDVVIVGGSANNFGSAPPRGAVHDRAWLVEAPHPWEAEFERIANERSMVALAERGVSTLEHVSASVGVARKALIAVTDLAGAALHRRAVALGIQPAPAAQAYEWASLAEYDSHIGEYLGYAAAMAAVARRHDQDMAFFWEYLLGHLGGIKPLSPVEQKLYRQNRRPTYETDQVYDLRARDAVRSFCDEGGLVFLDPLERLRGHDGTVFIDYLHYTREGNRFMARFMYESLAATFHRRAARLRSGAE